MAGARSRSRPRRAAQRGRQLAFAERALGLAPFESRADAPARARRLKLVATLHGMHWTGRALGVRVTPMFGANCANLRLPALAHLPAEAVRASATGNRFHGKALVERLRAHRPGLLVAGEADYDARLGPLPLFQRPWWERPSAWTRRHVRRFAHPCEGEPRGFTGVHESGLSQPSARRDDDPASIATLAFQDGTLEARLAELA